MGLDLAAADVDALEERTEGWVAGLQLAALSLRAIPTGPRSRASSRRSPAATGSSSTTWPTRSWPGSRPTCATSCCSTAVLDRLTGPLCDAVTGRADGSRLLEELERDNLFLVPLDTERSWYRYHHLFADVLRARLLSEQPDLVPLLHRRASDWYADRGLAADAVRHALAGRGLRPGRLPDGGGAARDAAAPAGRLLVVGAGAARRRVVRRSPVLSIVAGWALLMSGDLDAVEPRLDDAEAALAAGADDPALAATWADTEELRTAPATIPSTARRWPRPAATSPAPSAMPGRPWTWPDPRTTSSTAPRAGSSAWPPGRPGTSRGPRDVRPRPSAACTPLATSSTSSTARSCSPTCGWPPGGPAGPAGCASRRCRPRPGAASRTRAPTADLHVALAELDRELDDLAGAEAHLETAGSSASAPPSPRTGTAGPSPWPGCAPRRGDHDAALELLDRAEALYRPGFHPDVRPIAAMRARVQIARGDLAAAAAWARDTGVGVDDDPDYLHEYEHLTLVRLLLAQHRAGTPTRHAAGLARAARAAARGAADTGRAGSLLEIRMLQALAHHPHGDVGAALAVLGGRWPRPRSPRARCGCTSTRARRCWPCCATPRTGRPGRRREPGARARRHGRPIERAPARSSPCPTR